MPLSKDDEGPEEKTEKKALHQDATIVGIPISAAAKTKTAMQTSNGA